MWSDIPGWFGFRLTYDEIIAATPDGAAVVEIGVAFGRSLAYLAAGFQANQKTRVKIYGVDPFYDDWWCHPDAYPTDLTGRSTWGGEHAQMARDLGGPFSAFTSLMLKHAPEQLERINILRCRSHEAARLIGPTYAVMIDGDHSYEAVAQDIALWRPHMVKGGILAGDDYCPNDFPGVVRAVHEAFGAGNFEVRGTTWLVRT